MFRIIKRTLAVAVVLAVVAPVQAGGGKGGGSSHSGSSHQGNHYSHGSNYHNYHRYYSYYGWPYGYYSYGYDPLAMAVPYIPEGDGPPPGYESESPPPPPAPTVTPAVVRIHTAPNAKLWFDGTKTSQTGPTRTFTTPPLDAGKTYTYAVKACWLEDGRPVLRTKTVKVNPGETAELDLR